MAVLLVDLVGINKSQILTSIFYLSSFSHKPLHRPPTATIKVLTIFYRTRFTIPASTNSSLSSYRVSSIITPFALITQILTLLTHLRDTVIHPKFIVMSQLTDQELRLMTAVVKNFTVSIVAHVSTHRLPYVALSSP